jgi:Tol biopolymer transport system component
MNGRNGRLYLVIVVAIIASVLTQQMALADFFKLSGTMPSFGDVQDFKISPDGQYAVYLADQDSDDVIELYSVPLRGGTPVRLNGVLPAGSRVENDYQISPDSSRVVYRAPQDTTGVIELHSVPIAGPVSAGVKLNGSLVTGGDVLAFQISPDNSRAVYRADQDADEIFELYSVPLAGPASAGIKLNEPLVAGGSVWVEFQVSPDSSRVVYIADQQTYGNFELYSVPLNGPAIAGVKLNGPLVAGGGVGEFKVSPDSSRVVYRADQQTDNVFDLFSVPIAGPANAGIKLNESLVSGGDVEVFKISPDSSRAVYLADQQTDEVDELYSVPLAGPASAGVKLNGALVTGGNVLWAEFQISPDSTRVVYQADQQTDEVWELYSAPLNGPASAGVKLNGSLVVGGGVSGFLVSPNSRRVVYYADQQIDEVWEIYSVPLNGPATEGVKLNGALITGGDVNDCQVSLNSSRVIYRADQQTDEVWELYSVPLNGPASTGVKLNGSLVTGGDVYNFKVSPDSSRAVYRADQDTDEVVELYEAYIYYDMYLPLVQK